MWQFKKILQLMKKYFWRDGDQLVLFGPVEAKSSAKLLIVDFKQIVIGVLFFLRYLFSNFK